MSCVMRFLNATVRLIMKAEHDSNGSQMFLSTYSQTRTVQIAKSQLTSHFFNLRDSILTSCHAKA